jgi:hypothetical protein
VIWPAVLWGEHDQQCAGVLAPAGQVHRADDLGGDRVADRRCGAQVMMLGDFHVNDVLAMVAELGGKPDTSRRSNSIRSGTLS